MTTENLGNELNRIVNDAKSLLFNQGEFAQLSYGAFDVAASNVQSHEKDEIEITFPVGWMPNKQPITSTRKYKKDELFKRYQFLALYQLSVNGLVQLVTIVEAMLGDLIRAIVLKYPQKLGSKRTMALEAILEASSIEEIHLRATDALLNELSYKSPGEFAEAAQQLLSINLLECPAFHKYMEIKASRDIFIHNRGVVNEIYERKAGSHMRVRSGMSLPADTVYFLESYEVCLQLNEWLEAKLHEHWHSSLFEDKQQMQTELKLPSSN
jgi:hypothetical protein